MLNQKQLNVIILIFICFFFLIFSGCVSVSEQSTDNTGGLTVCKDPRPEICTQEYLPVCGHLADGSQKTYSNGCSACADKNVIKYKTGPCPEEPVQ